MATHFSIFAWEIPRTEEPGGQQSIRVQKSLIQLIAKQQQQRQHFIINLFLPGG